MRRPFVFSPQETIAAIGIGVGVGSLLAAYASAILPLATIGAILGLLYALRHSAIARVAGAVLLVVIFAAVLLGPRETGGMQKAYVMAMKSDLRNLVLAQDEYFQAHNTFASDLAALDAWRSSTGVHLVIDVADTKGWRATATHSAVTNVCSIAAGDQAADSARNQPVCGAGKLSPGYHAYRDSLRRAYDEVERNRAPAMVRWVPVARADCAFSRTANSTPFALREPMDLGYPVRTVDPLAVRRMLLDRKYDALDAVLTALADSARRDFRLEYRMSDAYRAFDVAMPELQPFLDDWVRVRPASANALFVRAQYYAAVGWNAPSTTVTDRVSGKQISRMRDYFERAQADIDSAWHRAPCNVMGYHVLLQNAPRIGDDDFSRQLLDQALTLQPHSFLLRVRHMYNIRPRWSEGSHANMAHFASESDTLVARNPRLIALRGFVAWDSAETLASKGDTAGALAKYSEALDAADFWQFRLDRGELYRQMHRDEQALADLERAIVQRPNRADVVITHSITEYAVGVKQQGEARQQLVTKAIREAGVAARIDPTDSWPRTWVDWYRQNLPRFAHLLADSASRF